MYNWVVTSGPRAVIAMNVDLTLLNFIFVILNVEPSLEMQVLHCSRKENIDSSSV